MFGFRYRIGGLVTKVFKNFNSSLYFHTQTELRGDEVRDRFTFFIAVCLESRLGLLNSGKAELMRNVSTSDRMYCLPATWRYRRASLAIRGRTQQ